MLGKNIRERILWLFSWEALFNNFGDLSRRWRQLLGSLVQASCLSGVAVFYLLADSPWVLLTPALFALSGAAYIPLSAYLKRMAHHRADDKLIAVGRRMDGHEKDLFGRAQDNAQRIQGIVAIAGILYIAYATTYDWRLPETIGGWGPIIFAVCWLYVYSLPTVIAAWIDREDHLEDPPDSEGLD